MTNEEAIKILRKSSLADSEESADEFCEAYDLAIKALEKQIPMKVAHTIDHTWGKETIQPICPSCDYYLPHFEFIGNGERSTYCEHCGQRILWEDVSE